MVELAISQIHWIGMYLYALENNNRKMLDTRTCAHWPETDILTWQHRLTALLTLVNGWQLQKNTLPNS